MNTLELRWVRRSTNGLANKITNEGVNKEGPELDITWINILEGQFRMDCIQLATKDCDSSLSKEGHIEEGNERPSRRLEGPRQDMTASTIDYNVESDYTKDEGTATRLCQK
jgi:hypothetical protein